MGDVYHDATSFCSLRVAREQHTEKEGYKAPLAYPPRARTRKKRRFAVTTESLASLSKSTARGTRPVSFLCYRN